MDDDQSNFIKLGNSINGSYFVIENYLKRFYASPADIFHEASKIE